MGRIRVISMVGMCYIRMTVDVGNITVVSVVRVTDIGVTIIMSYVRMAIGVRDIGVRSISMAISMTI
jgi:hypothetical protein